MSDDFDPLLSPAEVALVVLLIFLAGAALMGVVAFAFLLPEPSL